MTAPSLVLIQHVHLASPGQPAPGLSGIAAAALYVAVTCAGLLAAPVLTGVRGWVRVNTLLVVAGLAGYVGLVAASAATGQISTGRMAAAVALALVAGATLPLSSTAQFGGAAVLLAGEAIVTAEGGVAHTVVLVVHLGAAAIWAGGVLHLALSAATPHGREGLGRAIPRFTPWAVGSAGALVASGYLLLRIHDIGIGSLDNSGFGQIVIVKLSLLAVAAVLGLMHRMARSQASLDQRPLVLRAEAGVLAGAVGLAGILIGTVAPAPVLEMAGPGLAVVQVPDAPPEALLVTALGGDVGAVRVLSSEGIRLVDRSTNQAHQVGPGGAARVELRDRVAHLTITSGIDTVNVSVTAESPEQPPSDGAVTADPVSWLDYQLGRVLGISSGGQADPAPAPAGCAAASPQSDGAALGRELLHQNTSRLAVFTDSSARAVALVHGVAQTHVRVAPLSRARVALVATDAMRARALLTRLADKPWVRAVYLAPWLLDGRVLSLLATLRLPPLLVASTVDAMSPLADRYRAALAGIADGVPPSIAGFVGYADAVAPDSIRSSRLTLYSASPVGFLPGVLDVGHDHGSAAGWFSGGTLVPTNAAALRPLSSCPVT